MRKIVMLLATTAVFAAASGINCIPNVPDFLGPFIDQITGALGGN